MSQRRTVLLLGSAQTLAWASSYYLPAVLATPMARDIGVSRPTVFALFSMALVVSAALSPAAGRAIDRHGGRPVLMASNLVFAAGLLTLALAPGPWTLGLGWLLLGLAMGAGLYDAAFAALVHLHGHAARQAITGITLLAGFASTVGWPLSALLDAQFGWRAACGTWALLHLLLGLPLNAMLPRRTAAPEATGRPGAAVPAGAGLPPPPRWTAPLLALLFALLGFVSTSMAAHLPALLQAFGATAAVAVLAGSLIGPAQVAARLLEFRVLQRHSPLWSARLAALCHPLGALLLGVFGSAAALPFALLHGAGNGLLTIVRGTLPLALFGPAGYGRRQGWIALPGRLLGALSPWLFGIALERLGAGAVALSGVLCLGAFACLLLLQAPPPPAADKA